MTNRKNTKKALLTSVISLILCFSMLIGTTFAWFTDSVTSGVNRIIAGNLDVEVYTADGKSIEGVDTLFNDVTLWEPGAVAYENLTVVNKGTLALKYELSVNFANENTVTDNGLGLSDVLQVAVVKGGVDTNKSRDQIVSEVTEWRLLSDWYVSGELLTQGAEQTYGIIIWWEPSDEDNNWNVNNGKTTSDGQPLHIDLGVNLTAWQKDFEKDSYGDDYDKGQGVTHVSTLEELRAALKLGGTVVLMNDISSTDSSDVLTDISETYPSLLVVLEDTTLDLNGHTISFTNTGDVVIGSVIDVQNATLNIVGNGTILANDNGTNSEWPYAIWAHDGGTINVYSGTFGGKTACTVCGNDGSRINLYGGTYYAEYPDNLGRMLNVVNYKDAYITIYGGTFVNFDFNCENVTNPKHDGGHINVAEGYQAVLAGGNSYIFPEGAVVYDSVSKLNEELKSAEGNVCLLNCKETDGIIVIPSTYTGTLTLQDVSVASVQAEGNANIKIEGKVIVEAVDGSAITANGALNISGTGNLTAIAADASHAYGIGGDAVTEINITDVHIANVKGGYVQPTILHGNYGKNEPEGGAAIGSGYSGAEINLTNVTIDNAQGGSKAAGIGARYWTGVTINITGSTIKNVEGGNASAGIGGSRVSDNIAAADQHVLINITNSTINAKGGEYGAGIGSGYDAHCGEKNSAAFITETICTINIDADSNITAQGGKYAAGVGTGYHVAGLAGNIQCKVNATAGESREKYTIAQAVGFGVVDHDREVKYLTTAPSITYCGTEIGVPAAVTQVVAGLYNDGEGNYYVTTAAGLAELNKIEYLKGVKSITLMDNINFSGYTWNTMTLHSDSGSVLSYIDGGNFTISNMTINGQAMFGMFAPGRAVTISNLTFDNVTVDTTAKNAAVIAGQTYSSLTLDNVDVKNSHITGETKVATLVGTVSDDEATIVTLTVKNCDIENVVVTGNPKEADEERLAGLVAWVADKFSNDAIVLENNTMTNVSVVSNSETEEYHAIIYISDVSASSRYGVSHNEDAGVTVTNCTYTR